MRQIWRFTASNFSLDSFANSAILLFMSNTKRIVTLGDVRDEKTAYWSLKFAKDEGKQAEKKQRTELENSYLKEYPEIGVLQGARGRKFYAYVYGNDSEAYRSSDIEKVVAAINAVETLGAIAAQPFIKRIGK